ncbi:MAG: class I SAM-dependent methyltransferase [Nitrososphaerota archaeon]|nr:class I SAM-dependent methyltransferase [Nitrososphaerota archaeon]
MAKERKSWQDVDDILEQLLLKQGMVVADLACGPGYFTIPLSKWVGKFGRVYAVDRSDVMLRNLKQNLASSAGETIENVEIMQSDVCSTPIPDRSCDYVIFANVFHDIEDKNSFLNEVKRIAKPESKIVNIDWHKRATEAGPPLELRLSEDKARKMLRSNGLMISYSIDAGPYHYGLVCKVKN